MWTTRVGSGSTRAASTRRSVTGWAWTAVTSMGAFWGADSPAEEAPGLDSRGRPAAEGTQSNIHASWSHLRCSDIAELVEAKPDLNIGVQGVKIGLTVVAKSVEVVEQSTASMAIAELQVVANA